MHAQTSPRPRANLHRLLLLLAVAILCLQPGCKPPTPSGVSSSSTTSTAKGSSSISHAPASTPTQVAELVLAAMKSDSMKDLEGLIAAEKVAADVEAITRGRSAFAGMADNAVRMAAISVASELKKLDADSRRVVSESVNGEQATVTIGGTRDGQPADATLRFVREKGLWKLVPSHR